MNQYLKNFNVQIEQYNNLHAWIMNLFSDENQPDQTTQKDILTSVMEIFVNFVMHSRLNSNDQIRLQVDFSDTETTVRFFDSGSPFDCTKAKIPDLSGPQETGYGVFIVESLMDTFEYFPKNSSHGENITIISKDLNETKRKNSCSG